MRHILLFVLVVSLSGILTIPVVSSQEVMNNSCKTFLTLGNNFSPWVN